MSIAEPNEEIPETTEWRASLVDLREQRRASIYELEVLTAVDPPTEALDEIIAQHRQRVEALSRAIADLLNLAQTDAT